MKKIFSPIPLMLLVVCAFGTQSSQKIDRTLVWEAPKTIFISPKIAKTVQLFEGASYSYDRTGYLPVYFERFKVTAFGDVKVTITNATYEVVENFDFDTDESLIKENFGAEGVLTIERKQPFASVTIIPFRENKFLGLYERLISFSIEIIVIPNNKYNNLNSSSSRKKTASAVSVLGQGNWYKFSVDADGVYKLDYSFMQGMMSDAEIKNINLNLLSIYGNGGVMLPEANSEFRFSDLQENAIKVVDKNNNKKFDTDDYILFYGQSPHIWFLDTSDQRFHHSMNIYTDETFYFLTTDNGNGKRVNSQASEATYDKTINYFDDYAYNDEQTYNLIKSGRAWFGEQFFNASLSKSIDFNFPNLDQSTPVYLKSNVIARSAGVPTSFKIYANGALQFDQAINGVSIDHLAIYANSSSQEGTFPANSPNITVRIDYDNLSNSAAIGWLNFIELNTRRSLKMSGDQMLFRDKTAIESNKIGRYIVKNATSSLTIWDVTDPINIKKQNYTYNNKEASFNISVDSLKHFVCFTSGSFMTPKTVIGRIPNQDLHRFGSVNPSNIPEYVIVAHPKFLDEANELGYFHQDNNGLDVLVITPEQVYNEFSSGNPDLCAIRDFMKMLYDRGSAPDDLPRFLCLFGDGSYDHKNNLGSSDPSNFILTYQSPSSLNPVGTYVTDDFFGFLDDTEGSNLADITYNLDIGIGRIPVRTATEARAVLAKIKNYASSNSFGSWRNNVTFIGDDEDNNLHIDDADKLSKYVANNYLTYNIDKIYMDAYQQISTPGGQRYPDVTDAINAKMFSGTLIMSYTGHGGETGWAHERVLGMQDINGWSNFNKLTFLLTATCEFSRFDDPDRTSGGEAALLNPDGAAIGLMSTMRVVVASANYKLSDNFFKSVFEPINGEMPTLGEVSMVAKNNTSSDSNNRKFALFGDPAMKLAYPLHTVRTTKINGKSILSVTDTLKALAKVTIEGIVEDSKGNKLTNFNGTVYPTIYDKPITIATLKNDPKSNVKTFSLQKNVLYKGKASVINGDFTYSFIVPKDIAYKIGYGRLSYYTDNGVVDGAGSYDSVIIGGTAKDFEADNDGPEIDIFMNDDKFAFGGMTDENPILIVRLSDYSGINTVGNGIGHDLSATLDDNSQEIIILNDFYEADLDSYQSGEAKFPLSDLEEGLHVISAKAWDVFNNSSEGYTEFVVASSAELALSHVLNYPNPFTTNTSFQFEHNKPGDILKIKIEIYTVSGKLIKTIEQDIASDSYRVDNISWDGLDDYGDKIGKGAYIYRLFVRASDGTTGSELQKLVILN